MPRAWAAMLVRLESMICMAILNPSPSSPMRFSSGTGQSSSHSSAVEEPLMPILPSCLVAVSPGVPCSRIKAVTPWEPRALSMVANRMIVSATSPLVVNILLPLSIYVLFFLTALVSRAAASLPELGSEREKAPICSPLARGTTYFSFCSSFPKWYMPWAPSDRVTR